MKLRVFHKLLGGGVILTPLLTVFFGVDLRYAIGASLVSVIATSSGSAAAYVRDGYSNVRIGLFLEVATCMGALAGAALATVVPTKSLAILFGLVLFYSALAAKQEDYPAPEPVLNRSADRLRLTGSYPTAGGLTQYSVVRVPLGFPSC